MMTTASLSGISPAARSDTPPSPPPHADSLTASQWTRQTAWQDLSEQKTVLGALCALVVGMVLIARWRRSRADRRQRDVARGMVRDWRTVASEPVARELLLPALKPALLFGLAEARRRVQQQLRLAETAIERL